MKKIYASVYDDIVDAIAHAQEYALPLVSIKLTDAEWAIFADDHRIRDIYGFHQRAAMTTTLATYVEVTFMGTKIYRGKKT